MATLSLSSNDLARSDPECECRIIFPRSKLTHYPIPPVCVIFIVQRAEQRKWF